MIKLDALDWGLLLLSTIPSIVYGLTAATMFLKHHGSAKKFLRIPLGWMFGFFAELPSILALPFSEIYMICVAMVLGILGMLCIMAPRHLVAYGKRLD